MLENIDAHTNFLVIAIFATAILGLQILLSLLFGDLDLDIDFDGDTDFDVSDIFSPKALIHFLLGFGWWMWAFPGSLGFWDYLGGIGVGLCLVILMWFLYWGTSKLKKEVKQEQGKELVGRRGKIYMALGDGKYQAWITRNGALRLLEVQDEDWEQYALDQFPLPTDSKVQIVRFEKGIYYIKSIN